MLQPKQEHLTIHEIELILVSLENYAADEGAKVGRYPHSSTRRMLQAQALQQRLKSMKVQKESRG